MGDCGLANALREGGAGVPTVSGDPAGDAAGAGVEDGVKNVAEPRGTGVRSMVMSQDRNWFG